MVVAKMTLPCILLEAAVEATPPSWRIDADDLIALVEAEFKRYPHSVSRYCGQCLAVIDRRRASGVSRAASSEGSPWLRGHWSCVRGVGSHRNFVPDVEDTGSRPGCGLRLVALGPRTDFSPQRYFGSLRFH